MIFGLSRRPKNAKGSGVKGRPKENSRREALRDFFRTFANPSKESEVRVTPWTPQSRGADSTANPATNDNALLSFKTHGGPRDTNHQSGRRIGSRSTLDRSVQRSAKPGGGRVGGLSEHDLLGLFSGAPQFSISENKYRQPSVNLLSNPSSSTREEPLYVPFEHQAFSVCTLRVPLVGHGSTNDQISRSVRYDADVVETPNMLGYQGPEPGTVDLAHFLQLPLSDSLLVGKEKLDEKALGSPMERTLWRSSLQKLATVPLHISDIAERLIELGEIYHALKESAKPDITLEEWKQFDLFTNLYGDLLQPPRSKTETEGNLAELKAHIEALVDVLRMGSMWYDLSLVEWRIRIGQLLWASKDCVKGLKGDDKDDTAGAVEQISERDRFLLQLALASELLIRLEVAVKAASTDFEEGNRIKSQIRSFKDLITRKIGWDLVLARRFIENIQVVEDTSMPPPTPALSALLPEYLQEPSTPNAQPSVASQTDKTEPLLLPRNRPQQLAGLLHFAQAIDWPEVDGVKLQLDRVMQRTVSSTAPSIYATSFESPRSTMMRTSGNSYFENTEMPQLQRFDTARSVKLYPSSTIPSSSDATDEESNLINVGGWLSRSYLTGLILPGEAISHLLMSTLLENSPQAIARLGDSANLHGGFVYDGRSWWSKSCIVGRVLAPMNGAKECMGWISLPCAPGGMNSGWADVKAATVRDHEPRINEREAILRDSDFLQGNDMKSALQSDFRFPVAAPPSSRDDIKSTGLTLLPADLPPVPSTDDTGKDGIRSYRAELIFGSPSNKRLGTRTIQLAHDVYFVSSHPCARPLVSSTPDSAPPSTANPTRAAHPLHKSFKYRVHPVAGSLRATLSSSSDVVGALTIPDAETTVLDARSSDASYARDLEVLARAWCAQQGEHAIMGRSERTCLSCCVREARGAGIRVVIRV